MNEGKAQLEENREVIKHQNKVLRCNAWHCCVNCLHWKPDKACCGLFNSTPPAETLTVGCECWQYDIPF